MSEEYKADMPDSIRPYLDEIAERLWTGRAAVMVGAGFSKNAGRGFPDWTQLGEIFYQRAHGSNSDSTKQKYLNVLRLAEEVQAAIGRPALESLLRSSIPDLTVEPSPLHAALLELPWVDVFTTNFDTLLERASTKVVTRRYEPVINKEDIPYALRPRIVKLHGSFPSERPFIITEEDYRRYPHDYAPFVNTVQQSLLENTFCLIGFSGDDPNFLQWIGWIRDNLGGENTQKLYLVGVFDLPSARLQLLAQRGIIVVDLSCCPGIEKHDYNRALTKFFAYMRSKRPDALDWPYDPKTLHPAIGADRVEPVQRITEEWRKQRQAYPGWLIVPYGNRDNLRVFTRYWLDYLPDSDKSPPGLDIQYAFELIWRLERCLLPIVSKISEFCEELLKRYWPFHPEDPTASPIFRVGDNKYQELPWNDIHQAWLAIALAMLRFYRESGQIEKWREAENRLRSLSGHLADEQKEFLYYEGFLLGLFTLDLPCAKRGLENWPPNESQPYWMAKRAAARAEIGLFSQVDDQMLVSLIKSRRNSKNDTTSPSYLTVSNEAYQMVLLRYISDADSWSINRPATPEEEQLIKDDLTDEWYMGKMRMGSDRQIDNTVKPLEKFSSLGEAWRDLCAQRPSGGSSDWNRRLGIVRNKRRRIEIQKENARWDELKALRCDPWNELELFKRFLDKPTAQPQDNIDQREFDIGRVTRRHHSSSIDKEAFNSQAFLRFCEEVGLPFRVRNYALATGTAASSLQHIPRDWAIATLVRVGDAKVVGSLFNRDSICSFNAGRADQLIRRCLDSLNRGREDIRKGDAFRNDNYGLRLARVLPEIISRLCCKCSIETKEQVLQFITELYASPEKTNYGNVGNLTKRLLRSMPKMEQYRLVPHFLKIPYPEGRTPVAKSDFTNPLLLLNLDQKPECGTLPLEIQPASVEDLLQQATTDDADRRRWAISSLVTLHRLQLLSADQNKKLAAAIWCKTDQIYGLPDNTRFYNFAFLSLPHPDDKDPSALFRNYVKATPFPIDNQGEAVEITGGNIALAEEIIGANSKGESVWTTEEAADFLQRILEWWDVGKARLSGKDNGAANFLSVAEEYRQRFSRMIDLIAEVVGPKLNVDSADGTKLDLRRLLKEIREAGLPTLEADAATLHIFPEQRADIYIRIKEALTSNQSNLEMDGLSAIAKIVFSGIDNESSSAEHEPALMLSQFLTWGPNHSISLAMRIVIRILKTIPTKFSTSLEAATLGRLDRLLTETAYDKGNPDLTCDEKLEIRRDAAALAATLLTYYKSCGSAVPRVVEEWRGQCLSPDEFAEIRNAWGDNVKA